MTIRVMYLDGGKRRTRLVWGVDLRAALRTAWLIPGVCAVFPVIS